MNNTQKQLTRDARMRLKDMNAKREHQVTERMVVSTLVAQEVVTYTNNKGSWLFDKFDLTEMP